MNHKKCTFSTEEITFLGHYLSAKGITPTADKVQSIRNFRAPISMEEVHSFLGSVNYVGKFIPDLATITEPLRSLTRKESKFEWKDEHEIAFNKLKEHLSSNLVLGYYNVNDRTQLYADASPVGLGAVLVQYNGVEPRIISYASKSLSDTEKRNCQTEKEALALVWASERFHFYLFERTFELITDHKPLEVIFSPKSKPCAVTALAVPRAINLKKIQESPEKDETIQAVREALYTGNRSELAKPFKLFEVELCLVGQILLRMKKIIMPVNLRVRTL